MEPIKKVKIKIHKAYFAIYEHLLKEFDLKVNCKNRTAWIIESISEDLNVDIKCKDDIRLVNPLAKLHYYQDKIDWLREKMRMKIKKNELL